jgi:type VI secretion system secreted protein VgrG
MGGNGYNMLLFDDTKNSEKIKIRAERDLMQKAHNDLIVSVLNSETRTIGETFKTPTGSPSRTTTLKNGDDILSVENGAIKVTAKVKIELIVGPSKITIDPTGITLNAPTITEKATGVFVIQGLPVKIN